MVAGQHEGVDQDSGLSAGRDFFECLLENHRIETKRILVNAAVRQRDRDGLPSVIMTICRMSFFSAISSRRASRSPSQVFVW